MEITARLVADAIVKTANGDKKVTNFRVAINRRYKSGGVQKEETTYVDCSYWRGEGLAPYLTKGLLVQLYGHMSANAWVSKDGELMAGLRFQTNEVTLLGPSAKPNADGANSKLQRQA